MNPMKMMMKKKELMIEMDEDTILVVQAIVCIVILIFYPDIVAKVLAFLLLGWSAWWIVTE